MEAAIVSALQHIFSPIPFLALLGGSLLGVMNGALPAGAVPLLAVLLGFAYGMDPYIALPLAIGMTATVPAADTLPAVLLGMPGQVAGQATILDGYPMSRQGKTGVALAAGYFSALLGGIIGAVVLLASIPVAGPIVNTFGAPEFFFLGLIAVGVVGVVSSGALLRGLIVGALGFLIATIGYNTVTGTGRLTFGSNYLWDGMSSHIVPVIIGLFALPELIDLVVSNQSIAGTIGKGQITKGRREGIMASLHNWPLVARSSIIGVFVGILPGIGQALAQWLAYAQARQTVKGGVRSFGTGDVRGVIAPESANNAVDGGSLIPTLFFGVPGSVGMAIFLGFLVVLGLQPGPDMLTTHLDLTVIIVISLVLAHVIGTIVLLGMSPTVAKLAFIRPNILAPLTIGLLVLASFLSSYSFDDLIVLLFFGFLGFFMKSYGWPRPPIIIALVVQKTVEKYFFISINSYGVSMLARPQSIAIVLIAVALAAFTLRIQRGTTKAVAAAADEETHGTPPPTGPSAGRPAGPSGPSLGERIAGLPLAVKKGVPVAAVVRPNANGIFILACVAFMATFLASAFHWQRPAALFPELASITGLSLIVVYAVTHVRGVLRGKITGERGQILDIGRRETTAAPSVVRWRMVKAVGTTLALVFAIWLVGFKIAVPVYVLLYLYFFGKVRWWQALAGALFFVAFMSGVFDHVLHVTWPHSVFFS